MDSKKIEMCIYVCDLMISEKLKSNKNKKYSDLCEELKILKNEKRAVYDGDEAIINKVLNEYLPKVQVKWEE